MRRRRREQAVGLNLAELFAAQFTPGTNLVQERIVHRDEHFLVVRAQLVAHLRKRKRLDRAFEIACARVAGLRSKQFHRVAKMQRHNRERRQIKRAEVGHEDRVARRGNRVVNRVGVFQPGKRPLVRVAQLMDMARQLRELREIQVQRRRREIEQNMLHLVVAGQFVDFLAQVKE